MGRPRKIEIPKDEIVHYLGQIKEAQFDADIPNPQTELEIFWNYARAVCRNDLYMLANVVLGYKDMYEPLHGDVCDWLMERWYGKVLIEMPRGTFKSTVINVAGTIQTALRHPEWSTLIYCIVHRLAKKKLGEIKSHFERNTTLRSLFPDIIPDNPKRDASKWSSEDLMLIRPKGCHRADASIETAGVDSKATGAHYNKCVYDDIINEDTVTNAEMIKDTWDNFKMSMYLLDPPRVIWMIGTRYEFDDIYNKIETDLLKPMGEYDLYCRRIIEGPHVDRITSSMSKMDDKEEVDVDDMWKDHSIMPERFSVEDLKRDFLTDKGGGDFHFWCQMMNFTMNPKQRVFDRKYTKFWNGVKEDNWFRYIMVDPTMGKSETADNAVVLDMYVDCNQNWYIEYDFIREILEPDQLIDVIIKKYQTGQTPRAVGIETVGFQKFMKDEFERHCELADINISVHELEPHGRAKAYRIMGLQPRWKRKQINFPDTEESREVLNSEIYRWTKKSLIDDFLDCLAYGHEMCREFGYPNKVETRLWTKEVESYAKQQRIDRAREIGELSGLDTIMLG